MTEKIEPLGVDDAEIAGFDARLLMLSASELANHVTLRNSPTVEAGHPVDVESYIALIAPWFPYLRRNGRHR
jgi:hypothetical protein